MSDTKKYLDPEMILNKLDWEGSEGITWFRGDEFEDDELAELVDDANFHYAQFEEALRAVTKRASELAGTDG